MRWLFLLVVLFGCGEHNPDPRHEGFSELTCFQGGKQILNVQSKDVWDCKDNLYCLYLTDLTVARIRGDGLCILVEHSTAPIPSPVPIPSAS